MFKVNFRYEHSILRNTNRTCLVLLSAGLLLAFQPNSSQKQLCAAAISKATPIAAQDDTNRKVEPPKVFLDKNPRIVWYQLGRLSNEQLLLVERGSDDAKYALVHTAILIRGGMQTGQRLEALEALQKLNNRSAAAEVLDAAERMTASDSQLEDSKRKLTGLIFQPSLDDLKKESATFIEATESSNLYVREFAYAALAAIDSEKSVELASSSPDATKDWLTGIELAQPYLDLNPLHDTLVELATNAKPTTLRRKAIRALRHLDQHYSETFGLLSKWIQSEPEAIRNESIATAILIPNKAIPEDLAQPLLAKLVAIAESSPPAKRTGGEFIRLTQLAESLMVQTSVDESRAYRDRLREIAVRVVTLRTIKEEMRYDEPFFAVEAGRPVQVILQNDDLMPHNLVITTPGSLLAVAELALASGPDGGIKGKEYVPDSPMVLESTAMIQPGQSTKLTFTAPSEAGEYPYVCTFPRHAYRMYGVMVVVDDLDSWQRDPVPPADPIGSNRDFVKAWKVRDLEDGLEKKLQGRTAEIGQKIAAEATCLQCHKVDGEGGAVGPQLNGALARLKNDRAALLREILEPSHRIEPKYVVNVVITLDGRTVTGMIVAEDDESISVLSNPESPKPESVLKDDIDEITVTATSMMPKGLMDRFTEDEIFELLAFVASLEEE